MGYLIQLSIITVYLFTTDMVLWTRDEKMYQVLHVRYRYMWLKDMIPRVPVPQVGDTLGSMSLSHRYCWIRTCNTKSIFLEVHVLGTAWLNMYQEPGPQERRYSCNCMSRFVSWYVITSVSSYLGYWFYLRARERYETRKIDTNFVPQYK